MEYKVDGILNHRVKQRKGRDLVEYLVSWKGYDQCENTWEPDWHLANSQDIVSEYKARVGLD